LSFDQCGFDFGWRYPHIKVKNIAFEDKGKLHIEGASSLEKNALNGAPRLGGAREYLAGLAGPKKFSSGSGGYLWTTVHLSGTLQEPQQDLSSRVGEEIKESLRAAIGLFFRAVGDWFCGMFVR
jgi:hypothetical protein